MSASLAERQVFNPQYREYLKDSVHSVFKVAMYLHNNGYDVMVPAYQEEGSDKGDLWYRKRGHTDLKLAEVKNRPGMHFTDGFDFPYRTVVLCNKVSWDEAKRKPDVFFYCNGNLDRMGILIPDPVGQDWGTKETPVSHLNKNTHLTYTVDPFYFKWVDL